MSQEPAPSKHFLGLTIAPMPMAICLGALALVPFGVGVYYAYVHGAYDAARALTWLLTYLGTIVSFIGGVQWGRMLSQGNAPPQDMVLAVVPAIIAWPGLLMNGPWPFFVLLGALILAWLVDEHGYRAGWQSWAFLQLRRALTLIVTICVVAMGWRVLRG